MSSDQWGSSPWGQTPQQPDGAWGQPGQGQANQGSQPGQGLPGQGQQQHQQDWQRQPEQQQGQRASPGRHSAPGQPPQEDPQAPAYTPPPEYALQTPVPFVELGNGPSYGQGQQMQGQGQGQGHGQGQGQRQQVPVTGAAPGHVPGDGRGAVGGGAGVVYGQVGPQGAYGSQGAQGQQGGPQGQHVASQQGQQRPQGQMGQMGVPQQGGPQAQAQGQGQAQQGQGQAQQGQAQHQFGGQGYVGGPQGQAQPQGQASAQVPGQPAEGAALQEPAQGRRRGNGVAVAGLLTCFVPLVGLVLSIVGLGKASARAKGAGGTASGTGRRVATAGIVLSLLFSLVWAGAGYYYFEIRSPNAGDAGCVGADADYVRYSTLLEQDAAAMTKGAVGSVAFTFAVKKYQSDLSGLIAAYGADTTKAGHSEVRTAIQTVSGDLAQLDIELGNLASAHYAGAVHVMDLNSKLMTDFQHLESLCNNASVR